MNWPTGEGPKTAFGIEGPADCGDGDTGVANPQDSSGCEL